MTLLASWPCQDNSASPTIVETVAAWNMATVTTVNTSTISVAGPGGLYPLALHRVGSTSLETSATKDLGVLTTCTFSIWMKTTASTATSIICDYSSGADSIFTTSAFTVLNASMGGTDYQIATGLNLRDGNWKHICWTFNDTANVLKGYVNGSQVGTDVTVSQSLSHANTSARINPTGLSTTADFCGFKIFDSIENPAVLYAEKNVVPHAPYAQLFNY